MRNSYRKAFIFYFLMSIILLDFGNKIRNLSFNSYFESDNFSNPIISIIHTTNTGSAFGMFQNNSFALAVLGFVVLSLITFYVYKKIRFEDKIELLSITLFSAGALGNLIERLKYGHVIDYIKLNFIDFPIFNMFDIMICMGIGLYIIFVLLNKDIESNVDKDNSN